MLKGGLPLCFLKYGGILNLSRKPQNSFSKCPFVRNLITFNITNDAKSIKFYESLREQIRTYQQNGATCSSAATSQDICHLIRVVSLYDNAVEKKCELSELESMKRESNDREIRELAAEDAIECEKNLREIENILARETVPADSIDEVNACQIEITGAVGGQESMLFAMQLLKMYSGYCQYKGWSFQPFQVDKDCLGGLRKCVASVRGLNAYKALKYEGGVHRVMRVPANSDKFHTSTASVIVLPEPPNPEIVVNLDDCEVQYVRSSGAGGQNVNTKASAVILKHTPSGLVVRSEEERLPALNMATAVQRLSAVLLNREMEKVRSKETCMRQLQTGSKMWSERIRTYKYKDDLVIDHRLKRSFARIDEILTGTASFDNILQSLADFDLQERFHETLLMNMQTG